MNNEHSKRASATKSGPGRYAKHGKAGNRLSKDRAVRAYMALLNAWASKRVTKAPMRDEHGAYTLVGRNRNGNTNAEMQVGRAMWLGGISQQRGF